MDCVINRRNLIRRAAYLTASMSIPIKANAQPNIGPDRLWIKRADTGEVLDDCFLYRNETAARAAWAVYSHFWRDVHDGGQMVWIDRSLLVVLSDLQNAISQIAGKPKILILNSGYRTLAHNAKIEGAALNSLHLRGAAGDIVIPGIPSSVVAKVAEHIPGVGGIGRYKTFTHIDTGPQGRRWKRS